MLSMHFKNGEGTIEIDGKVLHVTADNIVEVMMENGLMDLEIDPNSLQMEVNGTVVKYADTECN